MSNASLLHTYIYTNNKKALWFTRCPARQFAAAFALAGWRTKKAPRDWTQHTVCPPPSQSNSHFPAPHFHCYFCYPSSLPLRRKIQTMPSAPAADSALPVRGPGSNGSQCSRERRSWAAPLSARPSDEQCIRTLRWPTCGPEPKWSNESKVYRSYKLDIQFEYHLHSKYSCSNKEYRLVYEHTFACASSKPASNRISYNGSGPVLLNAAYISKIAFIYIYKMIYSYSF